MVFLVTEFRYRYAQSGTQRTGQPQSGQKGRHIRIFPGTGTGADADSRQLIPLAAIDLLHQLRQIPGMLVHHLRLLQTAASLLHFQQAARFRQELSLRTEQTKRGGIAAGINT